MAKKPTQDQTTNQSNTMTLNNQTEDVMPQQSLEHRNQNVEEAYFKIIKECRTLLTVFDNLRYRTSVTVDHKLSGKEPNLQNEWLSYFANITLTCNKYGYFMIFFCYEEDAFKRFGDKQYNRFLRILFKNTNLDVTEVNIEHCIRIQEATDLQPFFINRILTEAKDYVSITTEEKTSA